MRLLLSLLVVLTVTLSSGVAPAQEDYPVPPGDPDTWQIPGRPLEFTPRADWSHIPPTGGNPDAYWQSQTQQALEGLFPEEFFFEEEWYGLQHDYR